MNGIEFNQFYLNFLLDKLSKVKTTVFLFGVSNTSLLNYDQDTSANEFLHYLSSHTFLFHILQPTRMRINCKNSSRI